MLLLYLLKNTLYIKFSKDGLRDVSNLIETLMFDYPKLLLDDVYLDLYNNLKKLYSRMFNDGDYALINDVDRLVKTGFSLEDAILRIAKVHRLI